MRGKVVFSFLLCTSTRITPACAGKRHSCCCICMANRDHPRMCGEKLLGPWPRGIKSGSPPHVRGKGITALADLGCTRITPACAGKSSEWNGLPETVRDHPRMCGEKLVKTLESQRAAGSPPHVRGKVQGVETDGNGMGITPACAGKSTTAAAPTGPRRDHPRMCGEK